MTKISREEVLRIAQMSAIAIKENEIEPLIDRLEKVLSYAERVTEVATNVEVPSNKNCDVFRQDVSVLQNPKPILAQAPERADNFFVVPMILDN